MDMYADHIHTEYVEDIETAVLEEDIAAKQSDDEEMEGEELWQGIGIVTNARHEWRKNEPYAITSNTPDGVAVSVSKCSISR